MDIKRFLTKKYIISAAVLLAAIVAVTAALILFFGDGEEEPSITADTAVSSQVSSIVSSEMPLSSQEEPARPTLVITSHKSKDITTTEPLTVFRGTSDPAEKLLLNGEEIKRDANGAFSVEKQLKIGENRFTFNHQGTDTTYIVRYKYVVIDSYSPSGNKSYSSGASFAVTVTARVGSTVTATFNGKTITLKADSAQGGDVEIKESDTFQKYSGSFSLPSDNTKNLNLGKVKFVAQKDSYTDTYYSGNITCKKAEIPVIGEVVSFSAETFNGNTTDDASRPTNNYFPKGTVDYVVGRAYNGSKEYLKLRCGRRVYVDKTLSPGNKTVTVTKEYAGKLPDTNKLSVAGINVGTRHTTLTLNTDWKAPFFLDLLPQKYTNPSKQDYTVSAVTCQYVEIEFCYASALSGTLSVPNNHPVFTRAEIKKNSGSYTLRLYLRRTGGFYGWDAEYNSKGQLVFTFLHPAQVESASNKYGADLSGVKIMLDVGHGGADCGALGFNSKYPESERNLFLAKKLKAELEGAGATVILNRTGNTALDSDQRCIALKNAKPDLCIAIHHDSNNSSRPNGFGAFHSTLFSREAARLVYNETMSAGIYNSSATNNRNRFEWHYYFVARMTDCPVVLTENGFMSNSTDYAGILSDSVNQKKAEAIARGVVKYFKSIKHNLPPVVSSAPSQSSDPVSSVPSSSTTTDSSQEIVTSSETVSSDVTSSEDTTTSSEPTSTSSDTVTSLPPTSSEEEE